MTPLSPRQKEVLTWAARGKTATEIAVILNLSYDTVRVHRDLAVHKLDAVTLPQATALGVASGVIKLLTADAPSRTSNCVERRT